MINNPYVKYDLSNLQEIQNLHNKIIETHITKFNDTSKLIIDSISLTTETTKNITLSTAVDVFSESLSNSYLMPAKRLKISKKTVSTYDSTKHTVYRKCSLELNKLNKKRLNRFSKMVRWSPMEKYQFYKGLKAFGLDFDIINKTLLPHRNVKDIFTFFKREDRRNSLRIDQSLEWFRTNSLYKKDNIELEACSQYNFSMTDASGECTECNMLSSKLNLNGNDIPSLESVMEETRFLEM